MTRHILIIGGGPAAMSCGLWLHNLGARPLLLEQSARLGGQAADNYHGNDWLLGHDSATGSELAAKFERHLRLRGIPVLRQVEVVRMDLRQPDGCIRLRQGERVWEMPGCHGVVIATGLSPVVPDFLETLAAVHPDCVLVSAADERLRGHYCGQKIAILGAGDNACENALALAQAGCEVSLFCRGLPRARSSFQQMVSAHPRIQLRPHCFPTDWRVSGSALHSAVAGSFDVLCGLLGYRPNSGFLQAAGVSLALSERGHIVVDPAQRSSQAGIWAAGDVAAHDFPCLATAIAQGAVAAKDIMRE